MRSKRGLACADLKTRKRVTTTGGLAPHRIRGLQAADPETRRRVATAGGYARAKDRKGLSEAGRRGGKVVMERYGSGFFRKIRKSGAAPGRGSK